MSDQRRRWWQNPNIPLAILAFLFLFPVVVTIVFNGYELLVGDLWWWK